MNHAQALKTTAIIAATAIEQLAATHNCSVTQVLEGIGAGHAKLVAQFKELLALGVQVVA